MSVGRTDFSLALFNNFRNAWSGVALNMTGVNAKAHYALIEARHRAQVETALAHLGELLWQPKPNAKESAVTVLRRISPADPSTWPELNVWMAGTLRTMHDLFRPIVRTLDAAHWTDPENPAPIDEELVS